MGDTPCWRCQNCINIAMLAAPQAFFSCFTKGTSIQTAGGSAAHTKTQAHRTTNSHRALVRMDPRRRLADGDDDQDERDHRKDDDDQIAIAQ